VLARLGDYPIRWSRDLVANSVVTREVDYLQYQSPNTLFKQSIPAPMGNECTGN